MAELHSCIGPPYRALAVYGVNRAHKRRDEETEESQGQRVTNEVEKDEPPAESSDVANQANQIAFIKVMAEVHAERYIGKRQWVAQRVGLEDRNVRCDRGVRIDVCANNFDAEPAPDLFYNQPCGTSNVQYSMDRQGILADCADNQVCITKPAVDSGEVPVSAFD